MNESTTLLNALFAELKALDDEQIAIAEAKRAVLRQAKVAGFDPPTMTAILRRSRKDPEAVMEADALVQTYEEAIGRGAAAAGVLQMTRNAEGTFEAKIVPGADVAEEKLSKSVKARREAVALAELARRAREGA